MRRTLSICAAILLAAGGLTAATVPAAAAPPDPAPPGNVSPGSVSTGMVEALQRDLGLSEAQAKTRIADDAAAAKTAESLRAKLGGAYAGSWVADGGLTVAVSTGTAAATVREAGATPTVVARSATDLEAVRSTLDAHAAKAGDAVSAWYVDARSNTVAVVADTAAKAAAFVKTAGVDPAAVKVVVRDESPRPLADVVGGDPYYINNAARCSIGFAVTSGFVTAGHCGTPGSTTTGYDGSAQGTFQASAFPGDDMAWVATSGWGLPPWVNQYNGFAVIVSGSTVAPPGSAICRSGSTTGWHCGTVQAAGVTVSYPQGQVFELTMTDVCAEPGDSGGSWMSGNQAQGVTSGGSGNCTSGGTTFFQPVNEILGRYGLSLVTG